MYVSRETPEQTDARLRRVIAAASFRPYDGVFAFEEFPARDFPRQTVRNALAIVRDEDVWSALMPVTAAPNRESFAVFAFHFADGLDNSGFVGWLASHLKAVLGTGVAVVCGQNSARGGIFDYWIVPLAVAKAAVAEIERLRAP